MTDKEALSTADFIKRLGEIARNYETQVASLEEQNQLLTAENNNRRVTLEKAIEDLHMLNNCDTCANFNTGKGCYDCNAGSNYKWRYEDGVSESEVRTYVNKLEKVAAKLEEDSKLYLSRYLDAMQLLKEALYDFHKILPLLSDCSFCCLYDKEKGECTGESALECADICAWRLYDKFMDVSF